MNIRIIQIIILMSILALSIALWKIYTKQNSVMPNSENSQVPEPDERIFQTLRENGDNLTEPRETVFILLFSKESDATSASHDAEAIGYQVRILQPEPEEEQPYWTCECMVSITPEIDDVRLRMNELGVIAARYNGEVDGWETEVVVSTQADQ